MDEPIFARVERVARTGSTNADLVAAVLAEPEAWPHLSVLTAAHQDAGRGRSGRTWQTPPGAALTASVLLRPRVPADRLGWVTSLTGLAVQRATARLSGARTGLKWPNDVLALDVGPEVQGWGQDRKLGGILAEVVALPGGPAVVVGIGVNVAQGAEELPVPWATSLALVRRDVSAPSPEQVLTAVGEELGPLLSRWQDGDEESVRRQVADACVTLGRDVRADLPDGTAVWGRAVTLGPDGALVLRAPDGSERSVLAGDVLHVRKGPPAGV